MRNNSEKLGREGELLAKKHLLGLGYQILETNWRFRKYEVDLIAKYGQTIVFIEVKSRKNNIFGEPEVFVTQKKQNFLIAAAHQFLIERNIDLESRFDVISIVADNEGGKINHLEGAFYPKVK